MTPIEFLAAVEFLGARYDEFEQWAKTCAELYPSPWDVYDRGHMAKVTADGPVYRDVTELDQAQAVGCAWLGDYLQHIAANHPVYVLADIAAKRAIIEQYSFAAEHADSYHKHVADYNLVRDAQMVRDQLGRVIRALLAPFAEHPDYDPKWAA